MAASAYAALVSLSRLSEQVLHPSKKHWIRLDRDQIISLRDKVDSLVHLLEDLSNKRCRFLTDELMNQMANAGHEAEDIIDSYVSKIFCDIKTIESADDDQAAEVENHIRQMSTQFCEDIERVTQTMVLMNQNLIQIQNKMLDDDHHVDGHLSQHMTSSLLLDGDDSLSRSGAAATSQSSSNNVIKNVVVMVGFEDHLDQMIDKLTNTAESKLQIIPIVGMGGLGKTTLAKNIYDKSIIVDYFHARAWVTLSQSYIIREVLLDLLYDALNLKEKNQQEEFTEKIRDINDEELGEQLHKCLFGRKYLIVVDDIWSTEDWERLKKFFPDNKNGSRIMTTTRLSNVANSLGPAHNSHQLNFLDEYESWKLFCNKVFPEQGCCPLVELEKIGRKIAKSCGGLPLAIVAIGGLLANSNKMTLEYWENVAEKLSSIINSGDDEYCLKLLSLSYNDLPIYLKPCFLYMAMFPEDCKINVDRLARLWVAEGFLKPIKDESLEDVGKVYLKELIDRNLILVGKLDDIGIMKSCKIHDVLRDLCIREAEKESFLCVIRADSSIDNNILKGIESTHRLAIHQNNNTGKPSNWPEEDLINALKCATNARTWVCEFKWISRYVVQSLNLVRVLDVVEDYYSAEEINKLSSLRYIAFKTDSNEFKSVFRQWNIQTFVSSDPRFRIVKMPSRIWEMTELRHIKFRGYFELPDPTPPTGESEINGIQNESYTLENLQTLTKVNNLRLSGEVVKGIPNLKKLRIDYKSSVPRGRGEEWLTYTDINNLGNLHKLESLFLATAKKVLNISFPNSLRKLVLYGGQLPWSDIKVVGSLPQLESLVLIDAFEGTTWDAAA